MLLLSERNPIVNQKRKFTSAVPVEHLHEVSVRSGTKTYAVAKGMQLTVFPRTNLRGRVTFQWATVRDGVTYLHVDDKHGRCRTITEADVKQVHVKTGRKR